MILSNRECGYMSNNQADSEKSVKVRKFFGLIASRYDLANRILSFGIDRHWRRAAVKSVGDCRGSDVLDMCCGSGDLAFCFAENGGGATSVTGCDFCEEMIDIAKSKESLLRSGGRLDGIEFRWVVDDCSRLGMDDGSFDIVTCGFGVRNMADLSAGLGEMYRLLRQGGKVCILEFSLPRFFVLRWLYLLYFCMVLPILGGLITGRFKAYRYLAWSVVQWDRQVDLPGELEKAGFNEVYVRKFTFGVVSIYVAKKGFWA